METVDVLFVIDYERLDVYRLSLDFIASTSKLREGLPRSNGELSDQFKRASFSLVLNIAEGAGKHRKADKQRYYSIARGSAMECAAIVDISKIIGLIEEDEFLRKKSQLSKIISMLSALCRGS